MRKPLKRSDENLHRSHHRADATKAHRPSSRPRRTCACLSRRLPDPRAKGIAAKTVAGGCWSSRATMVWWTISDLRSSPSGAPTEAELNDLKFAFRVGKHVKVERHALCEGRRNGRQLAQAR
ncbi:phosphoribosylaminoimidazolecarboxamide formyltransferase/IMP cyclohydrolase [Brucella suis]|nr:phosphoribosylaminoimidazolecarboxamide formyltransferase/IMP cyclohydrolase [Brucella suis]